MLIILAIAYYLIGWIHAAMHAGFPSDRGLLASIFLWPIYYINKGATP